MIAADVNYVTFIALGALLLSALTFVATQLNTRNAGITSTVRDLRDRVKQLEEEKERLKSRNEALEAENLNLMRKLLR